MALTPMAVLPTERLGPEHLVAGLEQPVDCLRAARNAPRTALPHSGLLWSFPESHRCAIDAPSARPRPLRPRGGRTRSLRGVALAGLMDAHADDLATLVAMETVKALREALSEAMGAVTQGRFFAVEGMRLFGRTMPIEMAGKHDFIVREPFGVAGLIAASNTPIANIE